MTKQIAVRLDEEIVEFIDREVAAARSTSRASVIERAIRREQRRLLGLQDAAIYARDGAEPDLGGLGDHVAGVPNDELD